MGKVKAHEIRGKKKSELLKQVDELKGELATLRVAQVTNGAPSKLGKIRLVRKNIARVLTVINQQSRANMKKQIEEAGAKRVPKQLRAKKTRSLRRALTAKELGKQTVKGLKKSRNSALKVYAVKP